MKKKGFTITLKPVKERRHFAPATKVIPNKKKAAQKRACRG